LQAGELLCASPDPKAATVSRISAAAFVTSFFFISLSFDVRLMFDLIFFDLILATLPQKVRLIAERTAEVCVS
jgi:hypothetical protein